MQKAVGINSHGNAGNSHWRGFPFPIPCFIPMHISISESWKPPYCLLFWCMNQFIDIGLWSSFILPASSFFWFLEIDFAVLLHFHRNIVLHLFLRILLPSHKSRMSLVIPGFFIFLLPLPSTYFRCGVDEGSVDVICEIVYVFFQQVKYCNARNRHFKQSWAACGSFSFSTTSALLSS